MGSYFLSLGFHIAMLDIDEDRGRNWSLWLVCKFCDCRDVDVQADRSLSV